jgi:hypothetical protein
VLAAVRVTNDQRKGCILLDVRPANFAKLRTLDDSERPGQVAGPGAAGPTSGSIEKLNHNAWPVALGHKSFVMHGRSLWATNRPLQGRAGQGVGTNGQARGAQRRKGEQNVSCRGVAIVHGSRTVAHAKTSCQVACSVPV